jgi:hypothetical protein
VTKRERLEREIDQLTQIIKANRDALVSKRTRPGDWPSLRQQINVRTARVEELQRQVGSLRCRSADGGATIDLRVLTAQKTDLR